MKELSLNVLDITGNSIKAGAENISITIYEKADILTLIIKDDGCGMDEKMVKSVSDPFCTTRTTRKVGLGIPFLKLAAEQTGGYVEIESSTHPENHGTSVTAVFHTDHIDFVPLGDIVSTLTTLIQGAPDRDFVYTHKWESNTVSLDTKELRAVLGDVSLSEPEVINWISESLKEQYGNSET